jgi:hypothetical protein
VGCRYFRLLRTSAIGGVCLALLPFLLTLFVLILFAFLVTVLVA